ncbi:hypothetical protein H5410_004563 [Solanum commersonii]|uniref:DUF4283 domain-containing protein n=1 Tax=Solanum commersonii TaxID=4109 RepID=A0A9J6B829_SOLCO|nr:hypothetical protein H5410_004563 [Solanum commersonii]
MESSSNLSGVFEEDELNTTMRSHPKRSREVLKSMQQQLNEDLNMSNEVQSGQVSGKGKQQKWENLFYQKSIGDTWYITKNWGNIGQPDLYLHEDGYYIMKFQNMEDMQEEFLTEIPLWFSFPNLPMNCWSCNSLSRIASAIGKPIYADECTTKQSTISYARMLIETNVTKPLLEEITVHNPNGRQFVQEVWFDWWP